MDIKKTNDDIELLAPAGSYDTFIAAVNAGASAVYMGLDRFNARVMTKNLSIDEYIEAIDYAHKRDVKVYLTLNTLLYDEELKQALELVAKLYEQGLDAVIVQDIGVASTISKLMPDLPLHASTQMSVYSLEQVKLLEKLGFSRVVLARELSVAEIEYICNNTNVEIEVFVHGALCVSFSGQCLMSASIGERSANRGNCAGPCRKEYSLYLAGQTKPLVQNKYMISKKDIFGLDYLLKLKQAGVKSFKIEGRNKTTEYVAGVVSEYRAFINNCFAKEEDTDKKILQLFNRSGKSEGYLNGVKYRKSISENSPKNTGLYLGQVLDVKNRFVKVKLKESINMHDGIEILTRNGAVATIVTCIKDERKQVVNKVKEEGNTVWLGDIKDKVFVGDDIYKTTDSALNYSLKDYLDKNLKRLEYEVEVVVKENENISARLKNTDIVATVSFIPEKSNNYSLDEARVKEIFAKTEDTAVILNVTTDIDDGLFVPTSKLNELRRQIVLLIENTKLIKRRSVELEEKLDELDKKIFEDSKVKADKEDNLNKLYVYRFDKDIDYTKLYFEKYNKKLDVLYVTAMDFRKYEKDILKYINKCKVYFVIPNVTLKNTKLYIDNNLERLVKLGVSGVLVGNLGFMDMLNRLKEEYGIKLIADYTLNVTNAYSAKALKAMGFDIVTPLFESDSLDVKNISKVLPVEIVADYICVMTTRYCVISSFAKNVESKEECKGSCTKNNYYLMDMQNKRYDIVTDEADCISRYVRNKRKYANEDEDKYIVRHSVV